MVDVSAVHGVHKQAEALIFNSLAATTAELNIWWTSHVCDSIRDTLLLLKISSRFFNFSIEKKKNSCATGQPDFSCRVSRGSIVIIPQHYFSCVDSVHERAPIQRNIKLCCLLFDLISYLAFFLFSSSLCHSREMPTFARCRLRVYENADH